MKALEHILWHTRARPSGPNRWQGLCPAHEDRSPSLSIRLTPEGTVLLYCFAGCSTESILAALGLEWQDLFPEGEGRAWRPFPYPLPSVREERPSLNEAHRARLERIWAKAVPLDRKGAEVGRRYLETRGLDLGKVLPGLQNLRVHPGMAYREGEEEASGPYPVLLARVEHPRFGLVALHRTYLALDGRGKAPVRFPKKLTQPVFDGATKGAAIRLYPLGEGEELALAEGIETALAVHEASGLPAWATVSAIGMERVEVPKKVRRVLIAADHDQRGLESARILAKRLLLAGFRVSLASPSHEGMDWLDVLKGAKEEQALAPRKEKAAYGQA